MAVDRLDRRVMDGTWTVSVQCIEESIRVQQAASAGDWACQLGLLLACTQANNNAFAPHFPDLFRRRV